MKALRIDLLIFFHPKSTNLISKHLIRKKLFEEIHLKVSKRVIFEINKVFYERYK